MQVNELPKMNMDTSQTGCCPKFDPLPWDGRTIEFKDKLFVKGTTINFFHMPLNMGSVMNRLYKKMEDDFKDAKDYLVLSYDPSPWKGEHFMAASRDVEGEEMVKLSGTYLTKVFEGPYKDAGKWVKEMEEYVKSKNKKMKKLYFFYTTCPKCIKHWKKNYVVAFGEV